MIAAVAVPIADIASRRSARPHESVIAEPPVGVSRDMQRDESGQDARLTTWDTLFRSSVVTIRVVAMPVTLS